MRAGPIAATCLVLATAGARAELVFVDAELHGAVPDGLDGATDVVVSPDGAFLYVAGKTDEAVSIFSRDPATGAVELLGAVFDNENGVDGLERPTGLALSPDGAHLYVASNDDDAVSVFARDPGTGSLAFVELEQEGMGGATGLLRTFGVATSPDGANVYAVGFDSDSLVAFARDELTGALTFLEAEQDAIVMNGPRRVTVSPDGAHVYVVAILAHAVVVFARDAVTGALTFVETVADTDPDVSGLGGVRDVAVSPDGLHLYAASGGADAIAIFERDGESGTLAFLDLVEDGVEGVTGLDEANDVVVSADGLRVYTAGRTSDAVALFERDPVGGGLAFQCAIDESDPTAEGLNGAVGLALAPPSPNVYVASELSGALVALAPEPAGAATAALVALAALRAQRPLSHSRGRRKSV